jgi:hypothetical protein
MTQKTLIATLLLFLLANVSVAAPRYYFQPKPKPQNRYVCKTLSVPYFDSIWASRDMDLQIDGSSYGQQVTVSGELKSVQAIKVSMRKNTLCIVPMARKRFSCRAKIRIAVPRLKQFEYAGGSANISITQSRPSCPITMNIYGKPKVSIDGNVRLCELLVGGGTQLSIYWVNSCDFYLRATDNARICLAGIAGTFEADSFGSAWINARYLRATRAFVKSYSNSRIDVRAICSLNALASQHSAIYYYEDPRFQSPYMQCAGSVIGMTHLCCPPCDLCDRACCKNGWH